MFKKLYPSAYFVSIIIMEIIYLAGGVDLAKFSIENKFIIIMILLGFAWIMVGISILMEKEAK